MLYKEKTDLLDFLNNNTTETPPTTVKKEVGVLFCRKTCFQIPMYFISTIYKQLYKLISRDKLKFLNGQKIRIENGNMYLCMHICDPEVKSMEKNTEGYTITPAIWKQREKEGEQMRERRKA